mgnify:CR=1 FL=1
MIRNFLAKYGRHFWIISLFVTIFATYDFFYDEYEKNFWIDLDLLIHKDVTDIITRPHKNITFIWNYWNEYERMTLFNFGRGVSCHTNSSFVAWDKGTANWLLDYTHEHWEKIEWTYKSLDKYLFYQHHRKGKITLWEDGIFSNFNKENYQLKVSDVD